MWRYTLAKLISHYFEEEHHAVCNRAGGEYAEWLADNGNQARCQRCASVMQGRSKLSALRKAWNRG